MKLDEITGLPDGPGRTAELVSWLQSLFDSDEEKPVLVGGAAVELYTGGAYQTGALDLVGVVPRSVVLVLKDAGFERRGRHFIHEAGEIFIEIPSSGLDSDEEAVVLEVENQRVLVVDPEALVADRLAAWEVWKSPRDGANAWLIAKGRALDLERVRSLSRNRGVVEAARMLEVAIERWRDGDPTKEELTTWAENVPGE